MCIKCVIAAMAVVESERRLAEAAEPTAGAESEEALARGEEIHETLAAAGTAQASQPQYDEYDLLEMERTRADIRNTNADTILKLANAAVALYSTNLDTSGVLRTLEQLYYPKTPDVVNRREEGQTEATAPESPTHDDVVDPLPKELRDYIDRLRAAGFEVDVIRIPL